MFTGKVIVEQATDSFKAGAYYIDKTTDDKWLISNTVDGMLDGDAVFSELQDAMKYCIVMSSDHTIGEGIRDMLKYFAGLRELS